MAVRATVELLTLLIVRLTNDNVMLATFLPAHAGEALKGDSTCVLTGEEAEVERVRPCQACNLIGCCLVPRVSPHIA